MKIETVVEPNEHIFEIQNRYLEVVKEALPGRHIEMVGGMAVPMAGRSELDILILTDDPEGDTEHLEAIGFQHRGVADDAFHLKQVVEGVEVTLQIMREDNEMVAIRRGLVELLRKDENLRKEYEDFKRSLSGLSRDEYRKQKVAWLEENILPKIK